MPFYKVIFSVFLHLSPKLVWKLICIHPSISLLTVLVGKGSLPKVTAAGHINVKYEFNIFSMLVGGLCN